MITFLAQTYIVVFLIILFISLIYFVKEKIVENYINKKAKLYISKEKLELSTMREKKSASKEHIKFLSKQLTKNRNLQAFDQMLNHLKNTDEKELDLYVYSISEVFSNIVKKYYHKNAIYKSYFAYLIANYKLNNNVLESKIKDFLLTICDSTSLYCRENSMLALANLGLENDLLEALTKIVVKNKSIHTKLLTECFTSFKGDHSKLLNLLLRYFKKYPSEIKVAILNYARLIDNNYYENIYLIMITETNEEVVYACLRYFGKNKYEKCLPYILDLGYDAFEREKWGYIAVISSTLKIYKQESSIKFLCKAISSPDWSARENAAKTLIDFYGNKTLSIIEQLHDKYAKEMVEYQMKVRKLKAF